MLYIPSFYQPPEDASEDVAEDAKRAASESDFLKHPLVSFAMLTRYLFLIRLPWGLLMIPVFQQIVERKPDDSKVSGTTIGQSFIVWVQWFVLLNCSLIQLSYAP